MHINNCDNNDYVDETGTKRSANSTLVKWNPIIETFKTEPNKKYTWNVIGNNAKKNLITLTRTQIVSFTEDNEPTRYFKLVFHPIETNTTEDLYPNGEGGV